MRAKPQIARNLGDCLPKSNKRQCEEHPPSTWRLKIKADKPSGKRVNLSHDSWNKCVHDGHEQPTNQLIGPINP